MAQRFKRHIATAKAKIAKAESDAFLARLEAIDAILEGATSHDVMMVCAHALAGATPLCCEHHQDEFRAEFLKMLRDFVAMEKEQEDETEAEADAGDGDAPPPVRH